MNEDFVVCQICGKNFKTISATHMKSHGSCLKEYVEKFPDAVLKCKNSLDKMSNSMTGQKRTDEQKKRLSEAAKKAYLKSPKNWGQSGNIQTEETIRKRIEKTMGMKRSEEQKKNISKGTKKRFDEIGFEPWNKGLTKEEDIRLKGVSIRMTGEHLSEITKEKLKILNLGKTHSDETKEKLSLLFSGDKNPSKQDWVKEKIKTNHISKKDPEKWEEIKEILRKHSIKNYAKVKDKMATGKEHSSKHGSKAQILLYKMLKKYFGIFYKKEVFINDSQPFGGKKFFSDITIPFYKIIIEWDGVFHFKPIQGEIFLKKTQARDALKEYISLKNGWTTYRIKDEDANKRYKEIVPQEFRKFVENFKGQQSNVVSIN